MSSGAERKQGFSLWEQLGGLVPVRGGSHLGLDVGFGQLSATVSGGHRDGRGALGTSWGAGRRWVQTRRGGGAGEPRGSPAPSCCCSSGSPVRVTPSPRWPSPFRVSPPLGHPESHGVLLCWLRPMAPPPAHTCRPPCWPISWGLQWVWGPMQPLTHPAGLCRPPLHLAVHLVHLALCAWAGGGRWVGRRPTRV